MEAMQVRLVLLSLPALDSSLQISKFQFDSYCLCEVRALHVYNAVCVMLCIANAFYVVIAVHCMCNTCVCVCVCVSE